MDLVTDDLVTDDLVTDVDVLVVGSGFGGSVAALRLAAKGYRVEVLEAGRRFQDEDFAKTSWDVRTFLWAPRLGCFGVQRIHRLPDVLVLAGAGVGGGSLNYACTLYRPHGPFYTDRQWDHITDWESELSPHYDEASRMLGVVTNPCDGPVERLMLDVAREMGVEESYRKTPVGVYFGRPGETVADPYFGGEGPARTGCTECGSCMVGCRVGAKNTLVKNYLALAERRGAVIRDRRTVTRVRPIDPSRPERGYRVEHERTGAWVGRDRRETTATYVVMAAGAFGTSRLLHRLRHTGDLPRLSPALGRLTRTNSEMIGGAGTRRVPAGMDLTKGVAITSSFHPDQDTHVENCRYGVGSNLMGGLTALLVPGGGRVPRFVRYLGEVARDPLGAARSLWLRRWSERTVIGLVMQSRDNSLTTSYRRGPLGGHSMTSEQGHGEPNPTWIPAGHAALRSIARHLETVTGIPADARGSVGEVVDMPMTAHYLGGAVISDDPETGVVDPYQRVWGYPGISVLDGAAVSANLGVNPSLTITAQAERATSLWPRRGEEDPRPAQGEAYRRLDVPAPVASEPSR